MTAKTVTGLFATELGGCLMIRTQHLEATTVKLIGPDAPWESVEQMAEDLNIAPMYDHEEGWRERGDRIDAAVALLRAPQ